MNYPIQLVIDEDILRIVTTNNEVECFFVFT